MTVAVIQEFPPSKLAAIVRAADGTPIARWAEDESKIENVLGNATKAGDMPGGHAEAAAALARDPNQSYPDLALFSRYELQGAGGEVLWSGGIRQEPQSSGDRNSIEIKAVGDKQFLEDDEGAIGPGFIDSDLSKWGEPSVTRKQIDAGGAKVNVNGSAQLLPAGGVGATPLAAAISHMWAQMASSKASPDVAESVYDSGNIEIGRVLYDFVDPTGTNSSTSFWLNCIAALATGLYSEGYELSADLEGPEKVQQEFAVAAGRFFLAMIDYFNETHEGPGPWEVLRRNVKILGRLGLELQGEWPNVGFLAKQMLPFIAELAGLTTKDELLEDDGFVIPQAWFSAPGTPMSKLIEVTKYGLLDWFVFQDQLLQYRFPRTYGRQWRLASGSSAPKNSGPDASRVWDGGLGTYQDADGTTKTVGAPGSGAMFEDARLQITDPRNAAVAAGRPRRKLLALNGVMTSELAIKTMARFLEEAANLDQSGEATISGYCQDQYGTWWPAAYVQPGDWAADPGTQNYRKITSASYAHDPKTASVSLGAPPQGLEALEARFNARLIELGF